MTPERARWVTLGSQWVSLGMLIFSVSFAYLWYVPRAEFRAHAKGMIELSRTCHSVAKQQVDDYARLAQMRLCVVLTDQTLEWYKDNKP